VPYSVPHGVVRHIPLRCVMLRRVSFALRSGENAATVFAAVLFPREDCDHCREAMLVFRANKRVQLSSSDRYLVHACSRPAPLYGRRGRHETKAASRRAIKTINVATARERRQAARWGEPEEEKEDGRGVRPSVRPPGNCVYGGGGGGGGGRAPVGQSVGRWSPRVVVVVIDVAADGADERPAPSCVTHWTGHVGAR